MSTRKPASIVEDIGITVAALLVFVIALVAATHVAAKHWGPLLAFAVCLLAMAGTAVIVARMWRRLRGDRW